MSGLMKRILPSVCVIGSMVLVPAPSHAENAYAKLKSYKATYEVSLDASTQGHAIKSVEGQIVYITERPSCSRIRSITSMAITSRMTDGKNIFNVADLEVDENILGNEIVFAAKEQIDNQVTQVSAGTARRSGSNVIANLRLPQAKDMNLGGDILFPLQHVAAILDAAEAARSQLTTRMYDGSEAGTKVFRTRTQIGTRTIAKNSLDGAPIAAWPIAVQYFTESATPSSKPDYTMSGLLEANGVLAGMKIAFSEFTLRGTLANVTSLSAEKCD